MRLKKKLTVPAVSRPDASVRAVAADPDRPIWFPVSISFVSDLPVFEVELWQ
jgi:hypothetical protein